MKKIVLLFVAMVIFFHFELAVKAENTNWVQQSTLNAPSPRGWGEMVYDSTRGRIVLFGGYAVTGCCVHDTWEYDGSDWTQISTANSPSARFATAMVYDSARQRTVLFAGGGLSPATNDTWEYDGTNWTKVITNTTPHARYLHDMVFDSARNKVVLFGGQDAEGYGIPVNDTWEYDGSDWTQISTANSPSARSATAMVYDSARHRTVLFSGAGGDANDTWEYDGTDWVQNYTVNSPSYRYYHNMAFDSSRGKTVLFGAVLPSDTWEYNGSDWSSVVTHDVPSERFYTHMAYDSTRNRVVLFGGREWNGGFVNDTWEYYVVVCPDSDGDGYGTNGAVCTNGTEIDCDDTSSDIHPGASDDNCNGIDEDCTGIADDGYVPVATACGVGECTRTGQLVCQNATIVNTCTPGQPQPEVCSDGKDNDCDGLTDAADSNCPATNVDLAVTAVTGPTTGVPGTTITIGDTTKNNGPGSAPASTTKFYWSTNTTWDVGDTYLGERAIPALTAGTTNTGSISVTVPGACSGIFYIIAKADADNLIAETNETNNTKYKSIKTGPDLIVSTVTAPTTSGAGKTITVGDTTRNQGGCPAVASTTKLYFSNNSTWDAADTYLGERAIPALAVGATSTGSTSVTIPASATTGTRYIIAKADATNTNPNETSETNNNKSKSVQIGPDLIVSALTAPLTSGAGKTITVGDTTKNQGGGPAVASTTKLYFSTNSTWDAADTYLGERAIPALAVGETSTGSTLVTIPASATAGTRYIIAKADATNTNPNETSETNNNKSKSIQIGPDLIVSLITAPTSAVRGSTISISDTPKNNGGGDAGASTTKLYLSTNTTWEVGDTYLGSRSVPLLTAGASSVGSTSVTIPSGIATGAYNIIAIADDGNVVAETNETNNKKTKAITINP